VQRTAPSTRLLADEVEGGGEHCASALPLTGPASPAGPSEPIAAGEPVTAPALLVASILKVPLAA
jgi:hypothetical protein